MGQPDEEIERWVDQLGWDDTDPARWCNYGTVHFVNVRETMCDGTLRLSGGGKGEA